jgi:hypothetical protein
MKTLAIASALGLLIFSHCSCKTEITAGQTLGLAGDLLDAYQRQRAANMTSAKTAVNVQPLPVVEAEEPNWFSGLFYAAKLLWP